MSVRETGVVCEADVVQAKYVFINTISARDWVQVLDLNP